MILDLKGETHMDRVVGLFSSAGIILPKTTRGSFGLLKSFI